MMDPALLGRLIDERGAALVLYARQWCTAPEDVVQEAFLKLFKQARVPDDAVAWLYRVVRNGAISASRSSQRRRRHESAAAARNNAWFVRGNPHGLDPEAAGLALQGLPIEEREIIVGHLWGGLTFEQLGELTGSSSSTAHRRYLSGLSSLRERLGVPCLANKGETT
jgi:RNA polymerase sigma-70 factor (ECF subfamily)